ncbi:DGQHR domain-containing protein [Mumia sp. zg.B53]|uniref:DGQHR domain-containing protein n=1 Tax=Mumia sp. zg.B53 TaxID=2855449 RepID=UPI001C6ED908|nr:DGQHR domain-containing protein [Mumia sp. zg.B53]MBW9214717.1 DGQHR domain-containing protein [Mumia sp. zg.B53]
MFTNMGFVHLPVEGKEAKFGMKPGELDSVFVYENVLLIVEDTVSKKPFEHAKNKKLLAEQIHSSKNEFITWLLAVAPNHDELLKAYSPSRFRIFFLYISKNEMNLDDDALGLLEPMVVVEPRAFYYFDKLAKTIRRSARTDLWRFLGLTASDIGPVNATNDAKTIDTTIISPDDSTGFSNGVRLVSFMISADVLLRNAYVLRKDNWGYSMDLYQRLIDTNRIRKIRQYVARDGSAFLNNIILGLPPEVSFQTDDKKPVKLEDIQDYSSYRMTIPDEFNSLCIIDGQHRVFAHYEGTDALEKSVAAIRGKVHLLATGLVFPADMTELDRLKLQSEIFLDINSNTKPVPADVLLAIQSLRAPYADVAVARRVLEAMNRKPTFRGMFQLSQMDQAPIKIASIVKFALRYLVDIDSDSGLFDAWAGQDPSRGSLKTKANPKLLKDYVKFCASTLDQYFSALKSHHADDWTDPESKITSTTVINGMIIALRRSLPALGVLEFSRYKSLIGEWEIDFSKTAFPYASSQYARFSHDVLRDMFNLAEQDGAWVVKEDVG